MYVNYGNREDYEQLDRLGISVKGAIVIARYGEGWRGIKPKVAAEHGAIGCIIYSDPRGDGYFQGDPYPKGGWRPAEGVQRGSVMDTDYPGDPLTPGVAATADAKRLTVAEATHDYEGSGAADFVRGCAAAAGGARWAGGSAGVARCVAACLPHRPRAG